MLPFSKTYPNPCFRSYLAEDAERGESREQTFRIILARLAGISLNIQIRLLGSFRKNAKTQKSREKGQ